MKSFVSIALISVSLCGFITQEEVDVLRTFAPFEVYDADENPFKDYTEEQIRDLFQVQLDYQEGIEVEEEPIEAPESYDFRTKYPKCKGSVRNQASCGSCWAFSGAMAFQQRICIKKGNSVVLSPQDSVSCDKSNLGCDGGYLPRTWEYYKTTGLVTDSCFPYSSGSGSVEKFITQCKNGEAWKKHKVSSYKAYKGASAIKTELLANGPLQTGFTEHNDFMSYKSGIYQHVSGGAVGGHAVVIVGWGKEGGVEYWIAQNSWAASWGEKGYFRIKLGECGFDSNAYAGVPL